MAVFPTCWYRVMLDLGRFLFENAHRNPRPFCCGYPDPSPTNLLLSILESETFRPDRRSSVTLPPSPWGLAILALPFGKLLGAVDNNLAHSGRPNFLEESG